MESKMNRRTFLTGALAASATVAGGALIGCASTDGSGKSATSDSRTWDQEAEVVVVGMGMAGLVTAITASDAGSSVILIDKAPEREAGGNSRVCAQATWSPSEVDASIQYFKELAGEYHLQDMPDDMITAFITESSENADWITDTTGLEVKAQSMTLEYPLTPSAEAAKKENMGIPVEGLGNSLLWNATMEAVQERSIELLYETPLTDLVFDAEGEVIGIEAGSTSIAATKGVVLCCGGFEYDSAMTANYLPFPALAWGSPYNTGDAHKICMAYDIDFWHMNSATPATRIGLSLPTLDKKFEKTSLDFELPAGKGYFWTDKYGQRFMDENRSYQHGYGRNAIFYNDGMKMEYPRYPMWQIFDGEEAVKLQVPNSAGWLEMIEGINVSEGFKDEMAAGVVFTAETPQELAEQIGVDTDTFIATFEGFNESATSGVDAAFGRDAEGMKALTPPYYAAEVYPVMVNTNGGPRRDKDACILRTDGNPVPRLYSAGELGSIWAWYYQGAGNIGECVAFGRIAGRNVSALNSWKGDE